MSDKHPPASKILATLLRASPAPSGPWVAVNAGYDQGACDAMSLTYESSRYWDCTLGWIRIEIKKGRSIWIDLVRMAEHVIPPNDEATHETLALFLLPDKARERITEAIIVPTRNIINELGVTRREAEMLQALHSSVPRSLNAQASLTVKDVRRLSDETVTWRD